MKIEDAIKQYEFWAEDDRIDVRIRNEHRQIADWLKELNIGRPQGEWIIHKINGIPHTAECSCCHNHYDYEDLRRIGGIKEIIALPYCPNCGAPMKGADDV